MNRAIPWAPDVGADELLEDEFPEVVSDRHL